MPRLCRGDSQSLTVPGVCPGVVFVAFSSAVVFAFKRLLKGPFEGPATVKPQALPAASVETKQKSRIRQSKKPTVICFIINPLLSKKKAVEKPTLLPKQMRTLQ
jgi:hypothetical protein